MPVFRAAPAVATADDSRSVEDDAELLPEGAETAGEETGAGKLVNTMLVDSELADVVVAAFAFDAAVAGATAAITDAV